MKYIEIFDTRDDGLKCVRFESGAVGVVDEQGEVVFKADRFKHIVFAENDFVRLRTTMMEVRYNPELRYMPREEDCPCSNIFYADLRSGQMYGRMPDLYRYGGFEVLFIRDYMFTRTKPCHRAKSHPSFVRSSQNGLYLMFSFDERPEKDIVRMMLNRQKLYQKCLIKGYEEKVYWFEVKFDDESVVVMDDEGMHYYVRMDIKSGKAVWRELGRTDNSAEISVVNMLIDDIKVEVRDRMLRDKEERQREAAMNRMKRLNDMKDVVPFKIGNKWGLKNGGRIVVAPIYRSMMTPVGKYCAVEVYPGSWGVIAIDGKMEIEPKYEKVEIRTDGTVELTVFHGKTLIKKTLKCIC